MNNKSGGYGPAVRNRYNSEVLKKDNVACGNTHQSGTVGCDGIFVWISRRRVRCLKFEERCVAPTQEPTETPTAAPTHPPSQSPSFGPTQLPSSIPSSTPTYMPSVFPTEHESSSKPSQSHPPSASPSLTRVPTEFPTTSSSDSPTILASVMPSLLPSASQSTNPTSLLDDRTKPNPNGFPISGVSGLSDAPTNIQSSIPSDKPSLVPSMDLQSSIPSDAPSLVPSMLPTV